MAHKSIATPWGEPLRARRRPHDSRSSRGRPSQCTPKSGGGGGGGCVTCRRSERAWGERRKGVREASAGGSRAADDGRARSILLACPEGIGPADDGAGGKGAERAAVEGVLRPPVHQEDLVAADNAAAVPRRQRSAISVVVERVAHRDSVDGDCAVGSADGLARQGKDA